MFSKNLIKPISLIFLILVLAPSCEVQKRRYLKGYSINPISSKNNSSDKNSPKLRNNEPTATKKNNKDSLTQAVRVDTSYNGFIANESLISSNSNKLSEGIILNSISNNSAEKTYSNNHHEFSRETNQIEETKNKVTGIKTIKKEEKPKSDNFKRKMAIIVGISLLLMALLAIFVIPAVTGGFVLGDALLTAINVTGNISKFWWGVVGWIGILLLDIAISLGTYNYYKKKDKKKAAISGGLRLAYSGILALAITHLFKITISSPAISIYNAINMFSSLWSVGLIVFGLHLISLGILYNNEGGKRWINIFIKSLLIIAGLGYMIINIGMLIVPNPVSFAALLQPIFLIPMIFGETLYAIWMLRKGGRQNKNKVESKD